MLREVILVRGLKSSNVLSAGCSIGPGKAKILEDNHDAGQECRGSDRGRRASGKRPLLVEVISEGPHCVPCEYAIAAVDYVSEDYQGRIQVKVVETKRRKDASRYLELCAGYGGLLPIPSILVEGRVVFDGIPGPEEMRRCLDEALAAWEDGP